MNKQHRQVMVPVKTVPVDKAILPVIRWLNDFSEVITRWCCEGDDSPPFSLQNQPYIIFYCEDFIQLMKILEKSNDYARTEIQLYKTNEFVATRYLLRFNNKKAMRNFIRKEL